MTFNNTPHDNDDDDDDHSHHDDDDNCCYIALEQDDNESTRRFVQEANKFCITALGDPTTKSSSRYPRILNLIRSEDDERIPFVTKMGGRRTRTTTTTTPDGSGDDDDEELYNLWKDDKVSFCRCS
jgi:prolyl oligopeptidase PreP (S9A serine peptidase family)